MVRDEIVDEVRRERDRIAAKFDYDVKRLFAAMREEQEKGGREVVSLPPRRVTSAFKRS